jgi:hypothetical protein
VVDCAWLICCFLLGESGRGEYGVFFLGSQQFPLKDKFARKVSDAPWEILDHFSPYIILFIPLISFFGTSEF